MPLSKNIFYLWDVPNDKMEFTSLLMMGYSCDYRMGLNELKTQCKGNFFCIGKNIQENPYIFKES
jgi:hypothetical protein